MPARPPADVARRIFLIATEESGDRLGANLMKVLRQRLGGAVRFEGVGGQSMAREGLVSLFPIEELSIIGLAAVAAAAAEDPAADPANRRAVMQASPDILVIIDSPDFTHRVARRVRARDPSIPIVDYVSPSVWAWRPGRARAMRRLCRSCAWPCCRSSRRRIAGFSGPPCSYVGHPLIEQIATLRPDPDEQKRRRRGSRRFCWCCREAAAARSGITWRCSAKRSAGCRRRAWPFEPILPTMPHLRGGGPRGREDLAGPAANRGRRAGKAGGLSHRACGARQIRHRDARTGARAGADGDGLQGRCTRGWILRRAIRSTSVILANLVIGENVVPEFIQQDCTPENWRRRCAKCLTICRCAASAGSLCRDRQHHVDRQLSPRRAGSRYRAGDAAEGQGSNSACLASACRCSSMLRFSPVNVRARTFPGPPVATVMPSWGAASAKRSNRRLLIVSPRQAAAPRARIRRGG